MLIMHATSSPVGQVMSTCNNHAVIAVLQVCIIFIAIYLITDGAFFPPSFTLYMQDALLSFNIMYAFICLSAQ